MKVPIKYLVLCLLFLAGIFCLQRRAQSQSIYASIHGAVKDSTGAVVPGATVTALNTSTGITTTAKTDGGGYYIFPQLQIGGPYTVSVSKEGFQDFQSTGLTLNVNGNPAVDAVLKVGTTSQTVIVKSAAVQVETSNTQLQTIVGSQEIEQLPLLGRDPVQLMKTAPGVVESSDRFGTFSANGGQTTQNAYLLDGTDINDGPLQQPGITPNPDALAELNVITSTLNPEYSRNSGAIINEVLKSGTNQIHGDGFEFYRDTFLNNGSYFSPVRPPFHQNVFGGTLGGPVFKNRSFFFLAYQGIRNATGTTTLTRVPGAGVISGGNFTGDTNQQTGGTNGTAGLSSTNVTPFALTGPNGPCPAGTVWSVCFPNTTGQVIVPPSNYNSVASKLASTYVPASNYSLGGTPYYNFNAANTEGDDQGIVRLDETLTKNDTLWASGIFESEPIFNELSFGGGTLPGFGQVQTAHTKIFNVAYTHTFNPATLNELRAGYYRFNFVDVEPAVVAQPSSFGFTGITPQNPGVASAPLMSLTGLFSLGFTFEGPQPRIDSNYDFADNFSKVVGNHNLKFGAHVEKFYVHNPYDANNNGNFGFAGTGSFSSGDPLIDFLLGIPDTYSQSTGGIIQAVSWEYYFYAQDNWKVSDTLTINYGLGSDTETPFKNLQFGGEGIFCFAPGAAQSTVFPTAPPGLLYPGDKGCNQNGGATTKYDHLTPRFGFAWSPDSGPDSIIGTPGQHLFSVRGGFGMYFNRDQEEASLQNLEDPPFGLSSIGAADVGGSPGFVNPFNDVANRPGLSEPNKFPFTPPAVGAPVDFSGYLPLDIYSISPNYNTPYSYNFNLNVQRALPSNMVLQVGYVGSLGRKLVRAYEADQITAAGHAACLASAACVANRTPYPMLLYPQNYTAGSADYLSVGRSYTDGASSYNSLQVQLTKGPTHGLYFTLAYTYSHALDNASGLESSGFNGLGTNWVPGFQYLSYGNSDFDARHRFVAVYNYQVPLLRSMNDHFLVREVLGGWHITGVTALQSGNPISIYETGTNNSLYCNGLYNYFSCPDVPEVSTSHISTLNPRAPGNYWFNPKLFSTEPIGTFGNTKRNFFAGPGFNYTNLEIYKDFPLGGIHSPRYIELRLEAYNAFNHPNFEGPGQDSGNVNTNGDFSNGPGFGQITSVIQPANVNGDPQPGRAIQLGGKFYF